MLVLNTARKLLFSNLSYRTSEQNLIDYFTRFGSIEEISLFKDDQEQSLRRGFVTFYDRTSTDRVMEKRPHQIDGRIIEIHREIPAQFVNAKNISESLGIHLIVNEIFISRVTENETRQMFLDYFQSFGQIVDCRIYKGSTNNGKSTGYGFVRFVDYDSVDRIILSRPHRINSKIFHLRKSIPREFNYIVSSVKPLSQNKPVWRHYSMGLINTKTQEILYPSTFDQRNNPKIISSETIPSQKSIKIERPSTPKKIINSNNDFELIKSNSSSPSTISVVSSSLDLTPLGSPLYSTAIAYSPTLEINCKISSNKSFLMSSLDHHDKQAFELV